MWLLKVRICLGSKLLTKGDHSVTGYSVSESLVSILNIVLHVILSQAAVPAPLPYQPQRT